MDPHNPFWDLTQHNLIGSPQAYIDEFFKLSERVRELYQEILMHMFVEGLTDTLKWFVKYGGPTTL